MMRSGSATLDIQRAGAVAAVAPVLFMGRGRRGVSMMRE
jgi:hypothetical protein